MSRLTKNAEKESPSKKLRNIFYSLWKQDDRGHKDFDSYYEKIIEDLITHYKKKLK